MSSSWLRAGDAAHHRLDLLHARNEFARSAPARNAATDRSGSVTHLTYPFKKPCPRAPCCPYGIDGVPAVLCSVFAPRRRGIVLAGITTHPSGSAARATAEQDLPESTVRRTAPVRATFEKRRWRDSPPLYISVAFHSICAPSVAEKIGLLSADTRGPLPVVSRTVLCFKKRNGKRKNSTE